MAILHLALLGPFEITLGQQPVSFRTSRAQALLAYLTTEFALGAAQQRREALMELLWPSMPPDSARTNLRQNLYYLRQSLPAAPAADGGESIPFLLSDRQTVAVNPDYPLACDVQQFGDLLDGPQVGWAEAVALYRDEFLADFYLPDANPFEAWAAARRAAFRRQLLDALVLLTDSSVSQGKLDEGERYARRQLAVDPLRETAYRQLMTVLYRSGRRAEALRLYRECVRLLEEELDAPPSQATKALAEAIREGVLGVEPESETEATPARISGGTVRPPPRQPRFLQPNAGNQSGFRPEFVSRAAELARLDAAWEQALTRRGQVLLIVGEAGSGKSLLMQEFVRRIQTRHETALVVFGKCNAHAGVGDPYLPFLECLRMLSGDVEMIWAAGGISRDHALRLWGSLDRFTDALLQEGQALIEHFVPGQRLLERVRAGAPTMVPALAQAIMAATQSTRNPQQSDLFEQYTRVLQQLALETPVLLLLDDLQWADGASAALLFHLGRRLPGHRILVLGASRPLDASRSINAASDSVASVFNEFERQYGDVYVDLAQADGADFVEALIDSEPNRLGADIRAQLYRKTEGHPLYASELLTGLRRRGEITRAADGAWEASGSLNWSVVPSRVEATIADKVSQLPEPLVRLMNTACVEGERFTAQVVAGVLGLQLDEVIAQLSGPLSKEFDLVVAEGFEMANGRNLAHYRFRHNLFQTYCYHSLDPVERAHLHGRIAEKMEQICGNDAPERAGQLAYHFEQAQMFDRAISYLQVAAGHAVRLLAHQQAIQYYEKALALLALLPESAERDTQEMELRTAIGAPLLAVHGFGDESLAKHYGRARELCRSINNPAERFVALNGLKGYFDVRLELDTALELAHELLQIAQESGDRWMQALAWHDYCATLLYLGDLSAHREARAKAHRLYDRRTFGALVFETAFDPEVAGLVFESWGLFQLGLFEQAQERGQEGVILADSLGHPFMIAFSCVITATLLYWLRDRPKVLPYVKKVAGLADQAIGFWGISAQFMSIWAGAQDGLRDADLTEARGLFEALRGMGAEIGYACFVAPLAEMYGQLGRVDDALALIEVGLALVRRTGFRLIEAQLHTCRGELLQAVGDDSGAELAYQEAVSLAKRRDALGDMLRPATKLARMTHVRGEPGAAHELLNSVYRQFDEGFETPSMQEALELLEIVAAEAATPSRKTEG